MLSRPRVVDGRHVDRVLDMTDGKGSEVVLDLVGKWGAEHPDQASRPTRQDAAGEAMSDLDAGRLRGRGILIPDSGGS